MRLLMTKGGAVARPKSDGVFGLGATPGQPLEQEQIHRTHNKTSLLLRLSSIYISYCLCIFFYVAYKNKNKNKKNCYNDADPRRQHLVRGLLHSDLNGYKAVRMRAVVSNGASALPPAPIAGLHFPACQLPELGSILDVPLQTLETRVNAAAPGHV